MFDWKNGQGFLFLPWNGICPAAWGFDFMRMVLNMDYRKSRAPYLKGTAVPEPLLNNFQNILLPIIIC